MKFKVLAGLVAVATSLMAGQAQAGAVGIANMNITALGFAAPPAGLNVTISGESRTGTANANYNGNPASGAWAVGPGSITQGGSNPVDVLNRCAGNCSSIPAGTYNGTGVGGLENATNHIAVPGTANYALGDMFISGQAIGGTIQGLTRADAVATGPNNNGGANATILNSGTIKGTFTVGTTFTSAIMVGVDAFLQVWVDPAGLSDATASAGYGWTINISDAFGNDLTFTPSQLNKSRQTSDPDFNYQFAYNGLLFSDPFTFVKDRVYTFSINQSSNATVSDVSRIPEPASLALLGVALAGAGWVSRRRKAA